MSEQLVNKAGRASEPAEDLNLLDLLIVLAKHKKRIIGTSFIVAVLTAGASLVMPNTYVADTKILPPQQSQSSATAMLGQLGSLSGLAGNTLGIKNPSDMYLGMLASRTIGDRLISRFNLQKIYETKFHSDTLKVLDGVTTIASGKDGLINIQVEDENPKLAAALANAYVEELQKLMLTLAVTDAAQRRVFFEKQLQQTKQNLADAEVALKKVQEKTGLIRLEGQAETIINTAANIKAQIASKEVELGAMRTFATVNNPEYIRIQQELSGLRVQLAKVETGTNKGNGDIAVSTKQVPEVGLEYVRRVRDVKYNEAIFEVLAKQFEIAKIDEAKDSATIQVLDKAVEPDRKSKPKRAVLVLLSAVISGFLAMCWAFAKEWADSVKRRAGSEEYVRIARLRSALRWKKQ
jgi:tyrosine-protein kinase Etk/Wzc